MDLLLGKRRLLHSTLVSAIVCFGGTLPAQGNPAHDRLAAMAAPERQSYFQLYLAHSDESCGKVVSTFLSGQRCSRERVGTLIGSVRDPDQQRRGWLDTNHELPSIGGYQCRPLLQEVLSRSNGTTAELWHNL